MLFRALLNNKWIYFYGDSTMRQLASAFFNEFMFQNVTYKEAKAAARYTKISAACPSLQPNSKQQSIAAMDSIAA